jgi:hypothetical protein
MEENKQLISQEQISEAEEIAQRMSQRAGENTSTYSIMPTITVYNPSKDSKDTSLVAGDIVKTIKTQQGYETEKYEKPFNGIILKVRMFLKLKYKYAEGKPGIITNEFDSYSDDEMITVKKQDMESKYQPEFTGNYKEVNDKYSLKGDTEVEKKLDLHHAIYVLRDLDSKEVIRIDSKGLSRSNFFDYMNSFSRKGLDKMSSTWSTFDSIISNTDFNGKPRQIPIAAFSFTKGSQLSLEELKKAEEVQIEFEKQLKERDTMFGDKAKIVTEGIDAPVKEDIPTIQLDEVEEASLLPKEGEDDDDTVRIEDVPF